MTEPETLDLSGLTPELDLTASRALFERRRARARTRRRIGRGSIAAVLAVALGFGAAAWPDHDAVVESGPLNQPDPSPVTRSTRSVVVERLAGAGRIRMEVPDEFELTSHQGRDGKPTDGTPEETLSFDADWRLSGRRPGDRQISIAIWPAEAVVDLSRFTPIDDERFIYPAFYDTPPDLEWNKSVILQVDAGTVMFINGRNLSEELLLRIASSTQLEP